MKNEINIFKASNFCAPRNFPVEFFVQMSQWEHIIKSPYGVSFYTHETDWNTKVDKCLRISDHWNFYSEYDFKLHCKTNIPVPENHWALGQYDAQQQLFVILDIKNPKNKIAREKDFRLLMMNMKYDALIADKTITPDIKKRIDYSFLKKQLTILQECR